MSVYESSITNPKKQLEFYKQLSEQLQQENQLLKKQLEDFKINQNNNPFENSKYRNTGFMEGVEATEIKYINQQKQFIEYLENEINTKDYYIKHYADGDDYALFDEMELIQEILSKYKNIIGVSNDY